ncbi:MAG: DNA cytosine methyltransferase [Hyphomicrobiales bacterium]|nr:MAG: DNA cytosine methyltransferase [Hyphomicrobiales bacterium]
MDYDTKLKVADLFAGAGGFSLGAIDAGCDLVFAVEFNPNAALTYKNNIGKESRAKNVVVYNDDITKLDPAIIARKHFPSAECDILLGGPPCQGFSRHRIKNAGVADPRNALIHEYFGFVRALRPRAFLMENVPGMLWPRHRDYVDEFYAQAHASGYMIYDPIKIDARDYGAPQARQRVFILGLRQDVVVEGFEWPPRPTHCEGRHPMPDGLEPWTDCSAAFLPAPVDDPNDVHMNHGQALIDAFASTPHNGGSRHESNRVLDCHKDHDGHKDVYGRINPAKPAPTMTTACINPSKGRFVHPTLNHGITARQAARIQSFPDDYHFAGGLMAAGQQIGNAVPVLLAATLVGHIKSLLNSTANTLPAAPRAKAV